MIWIKLLTPGFSLCGLLGDEPGDGNFSLTLSFLPFPSLPSVQEELQEGVDSSCCWTTSASVDGEQSFGHALEILVLGRTYQWYYLNCFDSSVKLLASLDQVKKILPRSVSWADSPQCIHRPSHCKLAEASISLHPPILHTAHFSRMRSLNFPVPAKLGIPRVLLRYLTHHFRLLWAQSMFSSHKKVPHSWFLQRMERKE